MQLDIKDPPERLDDALVAQFAGTLGHVRHFIASGSDAELLERLRKAVPELTRGFDPLALYGFDRLRNAADFEALADEMMRLAPDAAIYYLEADLVLKGLDFGVGLVERWTATVRSRCLDGGCRRPGLREMLQRLLEPAWTRSPPTSPMSSAQFSRRSRDGHCRKDCAACRGNSRRDQAARRSSTRSTPHLRK